MSLRINGRHVDFHDSACWADPPEIVRAVTRGKGRIIKHVTDGARRNVGYWSRSFVVHTTSGTVNKTRPGLIESVRDWILARYQTNTERSVSWHATIDLDGSVIQQADNDWTCWHASQVNPWSDSVELVQTANRELTEHQLDRFVQFMDLWTRYTGIPRVIPWRDGKPYAGMLTRALVSYGSGRALCCIYGHRNVWRIDKDSGRLRPYRGPGDPSDAPFEALARAGYLKLDVEAGEDLTLWKDRQRQFGLDPDGIPGPRTRAVLQAAGYAWGQLVRRPGD